MERKIITTIKLFALCAVFSVAFSSIAKPGKVWMGISELAANHGANRSEQRMINTIGIVDSAVWGFAVGGALGAGVGIGVGL